MDMGKRILIIDDDVKFLKVLEDALTPRGFDLIFAKNGEQGLNFFKTYNPELLLIDALLPRLDGFQVCDAVRKMPQGKKVPIIMMTAVYKMPSKEREARTRYRVQEYLTKPIDLKNLMGILDKYIGEKPEP